MPTLLYLGKHWQSFYVFTYSETSSLLITFGTIWCVLCDVVTIYRLNASVQLFLLSSSPPFVFSVLSHWKAVSRVWKDCWLINYWFVGNEICVFFCFVLEQFEVIAFSCRVVETKHIFGLCALSSISCLVTVPIVAFPSSPLATHHPLFYDLFSWQWVQKPSVLCIQNYWDYFNIPSTIVFENKYAFLLVVWHQFSHLLHAACRISRNTVSLRTTTKIGLVSFLAGVVVGYMLKQKLRRWVAKMLKRFSDW